LIFLIVWVKIFFDWLLIFGAKNKDEMPVAKIKLTYHNVQVKVN
jgi:hypothetical protein